MRSRFVPELAGVALGAAAEGIWAGALAAALTGASAAVLIVFAFVTVLGAALLARRYGAAEGAEHAAATGREPAAERAARMGRERAALRAARLRALVLIAVAAGVLLVAGRAWAHPLVFWQIARDIVYAGGLAALGLSLGSDPPAPEAAVRRAVRAFALLGAVLLVAALAGSRPGWAAWAVIASLLVGGLLVAIVRYQVLTDVVDPVERLPAWPWLLAVLGAVLVVIAAGALLSQVLRVDVLLWGLAALAGVLRYGLAGVAYLVGYAGAGLLRAIGWLLGLVHVHALGSVRRPMAAPTTAVLPRHNPASLTVWKRSKLMFTAVAAVAAVALAVALVAIALRRFARKPPAAVLVVEEREALGSLRSAAGAFGARLGRRLRRRLPARRVEPRTPAELVRRRYAELEHRLARAGRPRPTGVTVRDHLAAAAEAGQTGKAADLAAMADAADLAAVAEAAAPGAAADLAAIYELARYSAHAVEATQAHRFEALARAFAV